MTPAFKQHLKHQLAPLLRDHGFRGSGVTFRRVSGLVIHILHIQGSRQGDACCVDVGTHLTFLPTVLDEEPAPKSMGVVDCEFRWRLAPTGQSDHWWSYGSTDRAALSSVSSLVSIYQKVAVPSLARFIEFPGPFGDVTPADVASGKLTALPGASTVVRTALIMARISVYRSLTDLARQFVAVGLDHFARHPRAVVIERRLRELEASLAGAG